MKIASRITPSDIDFKSMPYDERLTGLKASVTITKTNFIHPSHSAKVRDRTIPRNFHSFELRLKKKRKEKKQFPSFFFFISTLYPSIPPPPHPTSFPWHSSRNNEVYLPRENCRMQVAGAIHGLVLRQNRRRTPRKPPTRAREPATHPPPPPSSHTGPRRPG